MSAEEEHCGMLKVCMCGLCGMLVHRASAVPWMVLMAQSEGRGSAMARQVEGDAGWTCGTCRGHSEAL